MKINKRLSVLFGLLLTLVFALSATSPVFAQDTTPPDINGDQVVIGNAFRLAEGQKLNGNLAVMGGTAALEVNSTVNGDVAVLGGTLKIDGAVNGDVVAIGGQVSLGDSAVINGNLIVPVALLDKADGATVNGEILTQTGSESTYLPSIQTPGIPETPQSTGTFLFRKGMDVLGKLLWGILTALGMAALALLLVLLFPTPIERMTHTISEQPVLSGAVGLLVFFLAPLVFVMVAITIILSPFAVLGVILLAIALVLGWIALGMEVGNRMAAMFHTRWALPVTALVGVGIISLVTALFNLLWFCGAFVGFLFSMIGLGAVVLTRFGFKQYPPSVVYAPVVTPAAAPQAPVVEPPANE